MATFGKVELFHCKVKTLLVYLARVQLYLTANAVSSDKKVAMLMSVVESATHGARDIRHCLLPRRGSS